MLCVQHKCSLNHRRKISRLAAQDGIIVFIYNIYIYIIIIKTILNFYVIYVRLFLIIYIIFKTILNCYIYVRLFLISIY